MESSASLPLQCRPCRKSYALAELANPKRCPQCGGPTITSVEREGQKAATDQALADLQRESVRILRWTGLSMMTIQIMTYFFRDRQAADFFNNSVTGASVIASVATEIWAATAARVWMVIASIGIQIAAILFFFVATAFLVMFLPSKLAMVIACLPLAGSLLAWHHFRGYNNIIRLNNKRR